MKFPSFLRRKAADAQASVTLQNPGWLGGWGSGDAPLFGKGVSEETSMSIAATFRCVTLTAGVGAAMDLGIFTDDPEKGQLPIINKMSRVLSVNPFPGRQMTAYTWKELLFINILLHGNAYSVIRYDGAGRASALEYANPNHVTVKRVNQKNIYIVDWNDERPAEVISQENMIHIPGPGTHDGLIGMSRIRHAARNTMAMARSIEEVAGKAYDNAMQPRFVVKMPPNAGPDAVKRLFQFMQTEYGGGSNTGKTLFLDAGAELTSLQISVTDLALLEAMKANITQICMFFGVPPVLLGVDQGASSWGTGISQLMLGWLKFSLNSDLERIEAELTSKLCAPGQYISFDRTQLLSTDLEAQAKINQLETSSGVSTINEARKRLKRPRVEGGDVPLTNSTNIPLTMASQPRVVPSAPAPNPADDPADPTEQPTPPKEAARVRRSRVKKDKSNKGESA